MKRIARPAGLLASLLAILLLALAIELGASAFLYERSSRRLIQEDEAHRLAEHLLIARKLVASQAWPERPAMATRLTTDRYDVHWSGARTMPPATADERGDAYAAVLEWEPSLRDADLRVRLEAAGREARLFGALKLSDGTWLRFRVAEPPDEGRPEWSHVIIVLIGATVIVLIFGAALLGAVARPIRMLARATDRIGRSGGVTLPEAGPFELRRLIRAFNSMQERIHQLIEDRTQALAAVGHDLRTPLARLKLRAESVAEASGRRAIETDLEEMEAMIESLLTFLGGDSDPERPVLTDVAVMAATIADEAADRGGAVQFLGQDHLEATVRPIGLKRAISNLVENALHYGSSARVSVHGDGDRLVIRVDDDGPGIPPDKLNDVFLPFTRLDTARGRNTSGMGLGLAIVARAMEAESAEIGLVNRDEGGLRAELRIPLR